MIKLLDWIKASPPAWASERIGNWNDVYPTDRGVNINDFVTDIVTQKRAMLDMREVAGQWEHYAGQTWLDAVLNPSINAYKMKRTFRDYESNPEYFFSGELDGGITVKSLNGSPWFSDTGCHRTIVSKFACERIAESAGSYPMVCGATATSITADLVAWELACQLRQFEKEGLFVFPRHEVISAVNSTSVSHEQRRLMIDWAGSGRNELLTPGEFKRRAQRVLNPSAPTSLSERLLKGLGFGSSKPGKRGGPRL